MKKIILITFVLLCFCMAGRTQNLIENFSFEDTVQCPGMLGGLQCANGWIININSADYFNSCCTNTLQVSVPKNALGYQCPASGNAYAGFYAYGYNNPDGNEILGTKLTTPLSIGEKYFVSFKVSLFQNNLFWGWCGVDKLGALFTNVNYDSVIVLSPNTLIANKAHIYSSQISNDTTNWTTIKGSFIADSAYQFILLAHFFDSINTNFSCPTPKFSYYFIDDICVSIDSLTCEILNGQNVCDTNINISEIRPINENIILYPNPTNEKILINFPYNKNANIKIYTSLMRLIYVRSFYEKNISIDLTSYPNGMYLIQVQQDNKFFNKNIILIK